MLESYKEGEGEGDGDPMDQDTAEILEQQAQPSEKPQDNNPLHDQI